MSTNAPPCPPPARRALLIAGLAGLAAGGGSYAVQVAAETPDPVLALIEAERCAYAAWGDSITAHSNAEEAHVDSGWDRRPRALVGYFTAAVRGSNYDPIPLAEMVPEPVYLHDREAIDRNCDSHGRSPGADPAEVEARRARLYRELDEDAAAIAAAPETVREAEAERIKDQAYARWEEARDAVLAAPPATTAGLLALVDLAEERTNDSIDEDIFLAALISAVRADLMRRA